MHAILNPATRVVYRGVVLSSLLLAAAVASVPAPVLAQAGNRISESAPAQTRWQSDMMQIDASLRARLLVAGDPRSNWAAGKLDNGDPVEQVRRFAAARTVAPDNRLYLASLAVACLAPMQPLPPECDAVDRLADWATRDVDNGVPSLLLANRARQRNNNASMLAYLEEAAQRPRFDDYWNQGALTLWEEVRALPVAADPAAKAQLVASYGATYEPYAAIAVQSLCRDARRATDAVEAACAAAGTAVAKRAANWSLRIAGARLVERSTPAGPAREAAQQQLADVQRQSWDCAETGNALAASFESGDAAVRARAVTQWEARLAQDAKAGEVAACVAARKG
jgi:hypothetical protein